LQSLFHQAFQTPYKEDYHEAATWYQEAANEGLESAQLQLGYFYEAGEGVEQDPQLAVYWYQQASHQNYAPAHCYLAYCYEMGIGIEKDIAPIKNAISFPYSSGFVEGNNNKFKLLKRILYGRSDLVNLFRKCYLPFMIDNKGFKISEVIKQKNSTIYCAV